MPLFRYICDGCGKVNEILVRGSEEPTCPDCGSDRLAKQLSAITPMNGRAAAPAQAGCASCCQAQGGSCPYS